MQYHHRSSVAATNIKSAYIKKEFIGLNLTKCIDKLSYGTTVKKITKQGRGTLESVTFYISERDPSQLQWLSRNKEHWRSRIDLLSINEVSETSVITLNKKAEAYHDNLLCICYGTVGELVLVFDDQNEKFEWWCGLQYFIVKAQESKGKIAENSLSIVSKNLFNKTDTDGSRTLSKDEIGRLLRELKIDVDRNFAKTIFDRFDLDGNNAIDKAEFDAFIMNLFEKKELILLFKKYAEDFDESQKAKACMSFQELQKFYKEEQKIDVTIEEIHQIAEIIQVEDIRASRLVPKSQMLSFYDFSTLVFSRWNAIFNLSRSEIFQDMNRPLTDYYINSSHNTYLMSNQLTGESSIMSYHHAIQKGCRCVEIDLWNGDHAEPIVTHGHTLTSKIFFKDLIIALKESAFKANDYPFILSFEMHCDAEGQEKIAKILESHVRDDILLIPPDYHKYEFFPTLSSLKRKIIIKSKGRKIDDLIANQEDGRWLESEYQIDYSALKRIEPSLMRSQAYIKFEEELEQLKKARSLSARVNFQKPLEDLKQNGKYAQRQNLLKKARTKPIEEINTDLGNEENITDDFDPDLHAIKKIPAILVAALRSEGDEDLVTETGGVPEVILVKKIHQPKLKTHESLAVYYSLLSSKFDMKAVGRTPWEIASLNETKISTIYKNDPKGIIDFTKRYFIRVFPLGTRIDSSNYDPCKSWLAGAQMVALNFQTHDEAMLLNYAKFVKNGGSGYVLKPECILSETLKSPEKAGYPYRMLRPKMILEVQVISGQQFRDEEGKNDEGIINPFVEIKVRGTEIDETKNNVFKTRVIKNNGFNPRWSTEERECVHTFTLSAPEFATLVFKVHNYTLASSEKLGWYAIEVNDMQSGYRVVPMLDARFAAIKYCYLFVHIKTSEIK